MSTPPILEEAKQELNRFENKVEEVRAQLEELQASNAVLIQKTRIVWGIAKLMRGLSYVPLGASLSQLLMSNLAGMFWLLTTWAFMRGWFRYLDELTDHWYDRVEENLDRANEVMKNW